MNFKRRRLLAVSALGLLLGALPNCVLTAVGQVTAQRPNILLIITDQQHAGLMSCAGDKHLRTPALDRLAMTGTRFEIAYAANPVCVPSRVSMMTGRMPSHFGMRSNAEHRNPIEPNELKQSLGWLIRQGGYQTVYGGKTHWLRQMTPESIGFERLTTDERNELAKQCVKFFQREHDQPFFLVASFINPHDICYMAIDDFTNATNEPVMFPQSVVERQRLSVAMRFPEDVTEEDFYQSYAPPLPQNFEIPDDEPQCITSHYVEPAGYLHHARSKWSEKRWRLYRWAYRRLTEMVDAQIGVVLDGLRNTDLADSTVVIFTSDHGDMDAAHRMEHKSVLYEEAARVPLIISDPNVPRPFAVDNLHPVSVGLDLLPTLCDYAGVELPPGLFGKSIRPFVGGKNIELDRDHIVVESQAGRMVRTGRFKYVIYEDGENREQLIDLASDPGEMHNVSNNPEFHQVLLRHRDLLHRWVTDTKDEMARSYIMNP